MKSKTRRTIGGELSRKLRGKSSFPAGRREPTRLILFKKLPRFLPQQFLSWSHGGQSKRLMQQIPAEQRRQARRRKAHTAGGFNELSLISKY